MPDGAMEPPPITDQESGSLPPFGMTPAVIVAVPPLFTEYVEDVAMRDGGGGAAMTIVIVAVTDGSLAKLARRITCVVDVTVGAK